MQLKNPILFLIQTNVYASSFSINKISTNSEGTLNLDTNYSSYKAKLTNSSGTVTNQNISYVKSSLEYSKVVVSSVINKNGINPDYDKYVYLHR